jgi:hypothetical protein
LGATFAWHDLKAGRIITKKDDDRAIQDQFAPEPDANENFNEAVFCVTTTLHDFQNQQKKKERLEKKVLSASRKLIKKVQWEVPSGSISRCFTIAC